jgi:nucleotidyltransferase substrate binding protein (TIGR01987 family)
MSDIETVAQVKLTQLNQALTTFEHILTGQPIPSQLRDSALLNFMLTFELFWKTLKALLATVTDEGEQFVSPKQVLKGAYAQGWLGLDDAFWVDMHKDRNHIVRTYQESNAQEIFAHLPRYAVELRKVVTRLNVLTLE